MWGVPARRVVAAACAAGVLLVAGCGAHHSAPAPSSPTTSAAATSARDTTASASASVSEPAGAPPPGDFAPATATFLTDQLGFALGLSPCTRRGTTLCPALLRTANAGASWTALIPPPLLVLTDPASHPLLRFTSPLDGIASDGLAGDPLAVTHDGGEAWQLVRLPGAPADAAVSDLATAGGRVTVVAGDAAGARIWTAAAGTDAFARVGPVLPGTASGVDLLLAGRAGWLAAGPATAAGRATYLRTTDGGVHWTPSAPPCGVGQRLALAAADETDLDAVCQDPPSGVGAVRRTYVSADGGATFRDGGPVSGEGYLVGVAAAAPTVLTLATSSDTDQLLRSGDQGRTFVLTYSSQAAGTGQGLYDLSFTDATHGMVVLGNTGSYALQLASGTRDVPTTRLLLTTDGGQHWTQAIFVR
jgi:hypothetical protein